MANHNGGNGADQLFGGSANDSVYGFAGSDRPYGDSDDDRLFGSSGHGVLWGGNGDDQLDGSPGSGDDRPPSGAGADRLAGAETEEGNLLETTTPTLWGSEAVISFSLNDFNPQVAARSDNTFDIVWDRGGVDIVGRHFTALGNFSGGDFLSLLSEQATNSIGSPHIFQQADGRMAVDYTQQIATNDRGIERHFATETEPNGNSKTIEQTGLDEFLLDSTATAGGGAAHIFLFNGVGSSLQLRFTNLDGNHAGSRIPVGIHEGQTQQNPALAGLQSGAVAVAYENFDLATGAREVRLHVYTRGGADVSGEVTASLPGAGASFPDITTLRDGSLVVAWQQGDGIAFRQHTGNGVPTDPTPTLVPASASSFVPKITALNDGGFIIAWTAIDGTEGDGSPELDLFLQRFDAQGNAIGQRVHLDDPGDQGLFSLSIATLDDGRVIVTYGSETGDATGVTTLNYRIFDPREATIFGTEGNDNIVGREEASQIQGLGGDDILTGRAAADILNGGSGNDLLDGGRGNDVLNGGLGSDHLVGRQGNDSYVVDNLLDVVTELVGEGIDSIRTSLGSYSLALNVENLSFSAGGNFIGTGNGLANSITGGGGSDFLDGGAGSDRLTGGLGGDTYVVDSLSDVVTELASQGIDRIRTALTNYSLAARPNIENLSFTGSGRFTGTGNALDNTVTGGASGDTLSGGSGDDVLNGFAGGDRLGGGTGNDVYVVDSNSDTITELANQGTDSIFTELTSYSLAARANVENLTFTGAGDFAGTGNGLGNVITGGAGNDLLNGGSGNDLLLGGTGIDQLIGGTGRDVMTGAGEADLFVFSSTSSSGRTAATRDVVRDFSQAENDHFDLAGIDGSTSRAGQQDLTFIGRSAFTAEGQVRFFFEGSHTVVEVNTTGGSGAEMQLELGGRVNLVTGDFMFAV